MGVTSADKKVLNKDSNAERETSKNGDRKSGGDERMGEEEGVA